MNLQDFIGKWTGKPVDFDGIYPNQCMDLMHQYAYDVLGITDKSVLAAPAAYQAYSDRWSNLFEKIDNTPTGIPQRGDILFFGQAIGEYGHVCIFIEGDTNKFKSFDANWPLNSLPHIQDHDYRGVLGWLRPKAQEPMATIPQKELDDMRNRRDELYNENQDLKKAQITLNQKIDQQAQVIQIDARNDYDLGVKNLALEGRLNAFIKALGLPKDTSDEVALQKVTALLKPHDDVVKQVVPVMNQLADAAIYKRPPAINIEKISLVQLAQNLLSFFGRFK